MATDSGVALGKGAWDCDARKAIPPEKEVRCAARACACVRVWARAVRGHGHHAWPGGGRGFGGARHATPRHALAV